MIHIETEPSVSLLECIIVETRRPANTGSGFLTLELSVVQVVYTAADIAANPLTLETYQNLVEYGFNRERGGNIRFLALLTQNNAQFQSVSDVDVLRELSPTLIPTATPTTFFPSTMDLTIHPSEVPNTFLPITGFPSVRPSSYPSTSSSDMPSIAPIVGSKHPMTNAPYTIPMTPSGTSMSGISTPTPTALASSRTKAPTRHPSQHPSSLQMINENTSHRTHKLEPIIIAAIASGVFVLLVVCLCFLFCFYFKHKNKENINDGNDSDGLTLLRMSDFDPNAPRAQIGKKRHFGSRGSSSKSTKVETAFVPVIPKIVDLGEDGQSLADTTIGDQTAGRRPPKKKRFIDLDAAYASFDEESLYTSTNEKASGRNLYGIQPSSEIFEDYMNNGTNLGVKIDYDDEFLYSDTGMAAASTKMGLLGAIAPSLSMADRNRGLLDDELNGDDSDSFQSVLYMNDAESPISVALSNCDRDKSGDVRDFTDCDSNANVFIPMDDQEALGMLEDFVTHSESVKFLDEAANVYVEGHDGHKLLAASISSEGEDPATVAPEKYDSCTENSRSQRILSTNSDSQVIHQMDRYGSLSSVATDSTSSPPEGRTPFVPIKRTVKRNVIRPWAPTTRSYRTRPLGGVGLSKSHYSAQLNSTKPSVLSPLRGDGSPESLEVRSSFSDKEEASVFSGRSDESDKVDSWLFDGVGGTLGPRSESADLESLSGTSQKSGRSFTSQHSRKRQNSRIRPTASVGSGGLSHASFGEEKSATEIPIPSLKDNVEQMETQTPQSVLPNNQPLSPIIATGVAKSAIGHVHLAKRMSSKQSVVVVAPAGKLGIILANRKDGKGSVVSEVRPSSVLQGSLIAGDKLVAIDGRDVTGMVVSQITSIMSARSNQERRLTIVRTNQQISLAQEAKI